MVEDTTNNQHVETVQIMKSDNVEVNLHES